VLLRVQSTTKGYIRTTLVYQKLKVKYPKKQVVQSINFKSFLKTNKYILLKDKEIIKQYHLVNKPILNNNKESDFG
jgi:hypothetical protein